MTSVTPVPQCKAYVDFIKEVAESADYDVASCAAAMVPCMRLYAYLGQTLKAQQQQQRRPGGAGQFQEWVDTYADPGFEELAATLEALLDRYASAASKEEVNKLRSLRGRWSWSSTSSKRGAQEGRGRHEGGAVSVCARPSLSCSVCAFVSERSGRYSIVFL